MNWSDIAGAVGKAAPMLGTLLAGPGGAAVGGIIASALGAENSADSVSQALAANPDALVRLKQIESDERVKFQQMALAHADSLIEADKAAFIAEVDDRKNARQREIETKDWTPKILAGAVVLGWLTTQTILLWHVIDPSMRDFAQRMLGTLDMALALVLQYHFGSTAGSRRKTELIAKTAKAAEPNAVNG